MKAWLCENPVGVQALKWTELPTPTPGADEVLIRIQAASLNFPDLLIVQNKYQMKPALPFVPGSEYAGVIEAIGSEVKHLKVGQTVACLSGTGGFATHTLAPAKLCLPLTPSFNAVDAAAFIMIYATSYHALVDRAELHEKCALCRQLGADEVINYTNGDFREQIKALTQGKGPDVIYDPVGGEFSEPAFRSIAWRGRYLVVGFAAGPIPALPWNLALLKGASIVGVFWGDFAKREPQKNAEMMVTLTDWYEHKKIKPFIDSTMPMDQLMQAYERMNSRAVQGKLVMVNPE